MVSIEEIIALQKRDEAAKKQSKLGKEADKGPLVAQRHSSKGKGKEKGITLRKSAFQAKQATISKDAP